MKPIGGALPAMLLFIGLAAPGLSAGSLKVTAALFDLSDLRAHVEASRNTRETYPERLDQLGDSAGDQLDPWAERYVYRRTGDSFILYSTGKNGIDDFGTIDDIVSRELLSHEYYPEIRAPMFELLGLSAIVIAPAMVLAWFFFRRRRATAS